MAEVNNKYVNNGSGYMDEYISSLQILIEELQQAKDAATPKLEDALTKWITAVEQDARLILARPHWLLTKNITSKVKSYQQNHKVWAMAGFRFQEKSNPRDPGYYGQFHEAGWAPDRKIVRVPKKFLKRAKVLNQTQLKYDLEAALEDVFEKIQRVMVKRRTGGN